MIQRTVYILGQYDLKYPFLDLVHLIPSWLVWAEIKGTVHVSLPKGPLNQFELFSQQRVVVVCKI